MWDRGLEGCKKGCKNFKQLPLKFLFKAKSTPILRLRSTTSNRIPSIRTNFWKKGRKCANFSKICSIICVYYSTSSSLFSISNVTLPGKEPWRHFHLIYGDVGERKKYDDTIPMTKKNINRPQVRRVRRDISTLNKRIKNTSAYFSYFPCSLNFSVSNCHSLVSWLSLFNPMLPMMKQNYPKETLHRWSHVIRST